MLQGNLDHTKPLPPYDHHRSLGTFLLWGLEGWRLLIREVPLHAESSALLRARTAARLSLPQLANPGHTGFLRLRVDHAMGTAPSGYISHSSARPLSAQPGSSSSKLKGQNCASALCCSVLWTTLLFFGVLPCGAWFRRHLPASLALWEARRQESPTCARTEPRASGTLQRHVFF